MKRRYNSSLILAPVVFGLLIRPQTAFSASYDDILTGHIFDQATGQAIQGVNVVVVGKESGDATDEHGRFAIAGLPAGRYDLLISAIGYEDVRQSIQHPSNQPLSIKLRETFFQMGEVVVTGTRTEKVHVDVPVATEIISRQDILDSGARDVGELLDQRAGVAVTSSVAGGKIVTLLGIDSKYILILLDGQPVTGKFNSRVSLDQISTAVVDKVEIIKGPSSSLYGSEAMGGVINIITDRTLSRAPVILYTRFSGSDEALNPLDMDVGRRDLRLNIDRRRGDLQIRLDADLLKANVDKSIRYIEIDEYDKLSLRGDMVWSPPGRHMLKASLSRFSNAEDSHTELMVTSTAVMRNSAILEHQWQPDPRWRLASLYRYDTYSRDYNQRRPWGPVVGENDTRETQAEFEINAIRKGDRGTFNIGTETGKAGYFTDRIAGGRQDLTSTGLYIQYDRMLSPIFTVVAGTRVDDNNEIDPVYSPRLAAMVTPWKRWKFRTAWGKGFRMPTFMDRYIDWNHVQFGYHVVGNPDLAPETSFGYNLGVEYYHPAKYLVSLMVYQNQFQNMISDYTREPGILSYRNIDRVQFTGVELQGRWNISGAWLASWGYNYVDNRDMGTGRSVPNTQPHSASIRLSHKHPGSRFSYALKTKLVGPYFPEEYLPETGVFQRSKTRRAGYAIVDYDAKLKWGRRITLAIGLQNLTDYTDDRYGPFIGRTFYLELMTELKGVN